MAVKIRLKRMGKKSTPFYRIVIADSRKKRDGRVIEEIGTYDPKAEPSIIKVDGERAQYWLGVGAQPSEAVTALLKITGDIGGTSSLKVAEPKRDKADIFNDALKELHNEPKVDATTKKAAAAKKAAEKAEADAKAAEAKADEAPADEAKADEAPADEAKAEEPVVEEAEADEAPVDEVKAEEPVVDEAKA